MKHFCVIEKYTNHILRTGFCPDDSLSLQPGPDEFVIEIEKWAMPQECVIVDGEVKIVR